MKILAPLILAVFLSYANTLVCANNATPTNQPVTISNAVLTNHNNQNIHFYDEAIKDNIVVINFIFTKCTMVCPMLGYNFGRLQQQLGDQHSKVKLISVSVDPLYDTPEKLLAWAKQFNRMPGWDLYTGDTVNIDTVVKSLESFTADKVDHSSLVIIGNDKTNEWTRMAGEASPNAILSVLNAWL